MGTVRLRKKAHDILKRIKAELRERGEAHTLSDAILELDARANAKTENK